MLVVGVWDRTGHGFTAPTKAALSGAKVGRTEGQTLGGHDANRGQERGQEPLVASCYY